MKQQDNIPKLTKDDSRLVIEQVMEFTLQALPELRTAAMYPDHFRLERKNAQQQHGILEVNCSLAEEEVLTLDFVVLRTTNATRIEAAHLFRLLSGLSDRVHVASDSDTGGNTSTLRVHLKLQASLLSMTRATVFMDEVSKINNLARALQQEVPSPGSYQDLLDTYKPFRDLFEPVIPYTVFDTNASLAGWLAEIIEAANSGLCQAVITKSVLEEKFMLAALSGSFINKGSSLGLLVPPVISSNKLPEILKQAPGAIAVPAIALTMGSNIYERSNEMASLLQVLSFSKTPAIFIGEENQLQSLFNGGQGGKSDPFLPVVRYLPAIPTEELIRFGVEIESTRNGGLSAGNIQECIRALLTVFGPSGASCSDRLLLPVIIATVKKAVKAKPPKPEDIALLRDRLQNYKYSISGLPDSPRSSRLSDVQGNLVQKLINPELFSFFNTHIFAQDQALLDLCARLQMEVLTRPLFQPIRYCAQGTPGIGKSESTAMLARLLGVPFVNIDAASIPDIYTGSAQLLGSGRGLVGSYQSGRLEQAAKHRIGAVVEVSDLDHANPAVRCALADLFLQVLETGEAQSASGAMFSCANLIFVFSINLPNGQDEFIHRSLGYANKPDEKEVRKRIRKELKKTFSSAFVSRIGEPIVFNPLSGEALCKIVERACIDSLNSAAKNLNIGFTDLSVSNDAVKCILDGCSDLDLTSGARGIIEKSRSMVANALLDQLAAIRNQHVNSVKINTIQNRINLSLT